jgi:hypothetical protein
MRAAINNSADIFRMGLWNAWSRKNGLLASGAVVAWAIEHTPNMRSRPGYYQLPALLQRIVHRLPNVLVFMVVHLASCNSIFLYYSNTIITQEQNTFFKE